MSACTGTGRVYFRHSHILWCVHLDRTSPTHVLWRGTTTTSRGVFCVQPFTGSMSRHGRSSVCLHSNLGLTETTDTRDPFTYLERLRVASLSFLVCMGHPTTLLLHLRGTYHLRLSPGRDCTHRVDGPGLPRLGSEQMDKAPTTIPAQWPLIPAPPVSPSYDRSQENDRPQSRVS